MSELPLDRAGRRPAGFHTGHATGNGGLCYPADPPKLEETIAVTRPSGDRAHGRRLRGLIVIMWRAGLRIQEALTLTEGEFDQRRGSLLIRRGKGGRRREVGMDAWGWEELQPWLDIRRDLPVGPSTSNARPVKPVSPHCGSDPSARASAPRRARRQSVRALVQGS